MSERYKGFIYAGLGLHPWSLGTTAASKTDLNLRLIKRISIGRWQSAKIGLDYDKRIIAAAIMTIPNRNVIFFTQHLLIRI
jgi:Tat protein secretion system quality control protein TatD with DNase activity